MTVRPVVVRALFAVLGAIAAHASLALALVVCLEFGSRRDALATLDLSSVELSFAEAVDESAPAARDLPSPTDVHGTPKPTVAEQPPAASVELRTQPEPGEVKLREPKEETRLETESASREPQGAAQSSAAAPQQARIDAPPRPRRSIRPDYPKGARQRGEQGEVEVEISVRADGGVDAVRVVRSSGFQELDQAAVRAARAALFEPAQSGTGPVAAVVRLPLRFRLR